MAWSAMTGSCAGHYPLPLRLKKAPIKRLFHAPDISSDFSPPSIKVSDPVTASRENSRKDARCTDNRRSLESEHDQTSKHAHSSKNNDHITKRAGNKKTVDYTILETYSKDDNNKQIGDSKMTESRSNAGSRKEMNSVRGNEHALARKDTEDCQNTDERFREGPSNTGRKKTAARRKSRKGKTLGKHADKAGKLDFTNVDQAWVWLGDPEMKPVVMMGLAKVSEMRQCYQAIQHIDSGQVIQVQDCVLVRSGDTESDCPYLAKVAAFWQHSTSKEMMMSVLWYYYPAEALNEIAQDSASSVALHAYTDRELFASKHRDECNIACIEGKGYVLTFNEFCRYKAEHRRQVQCALPRQPVVPALPDEARKSSKEMPDDTINPGAVFFCRQAYDIHKKKLMKPVKFIYARPTKQGFHGSKNAYKCSVSTTV